MMIKFSFLVSLAIPFVLCGNADVIFAEKPIVINFSHVAAENTAKGQMVLKFRDLIDQRLKGKVVVKAFPNGQLCGDNTVLEAILLGDVQMAAPSLSKFSVYSKKMQLYDLPFLFQNRGALEQFELSSYGRQLLHSCEHRGLVGLGYLNDDFKIVSARRPLRTPLDAQGLRFRIQSSDVLAAQFAALQASAMKAPFSQVMTLLRDSAVSGQENTWANMYAEGIFAEQPFVTVSNHGIVSFMVVTSDAFWRSLDEPLRRTIQEALDEAIAYGNNLALTINASARQKIAASKQVQIISLTDVEKSQWAKMMRPVWQDFAGEIGDDLINAAVQANLAGKTLKDS